MNELVRLQARKAVWQARLDGARAQITELEQEVQVATRQLDVIACEIAGLRLAAAEELLTTGAAQ